MVSSHCRNAAEVNSSEPAKNTAPSTAAPTSCRNPGNGATRKHTEPAANSTAIHHEARRGAQWTSSRRRIRDSREACLRWLREDHSTVLPSGRRKVTWVVKGPIDRRATGVHPGGVLG
jgi:hypothetical protein